jgi:hypothetical protein
MCRFNGCTISWIVIPVVGHCNENRDFFKNRVKDTKYLCAMFSLLMRMSLYVGPNSQ